MIDRTHTLSIARQAALLDISRSAVYYLPRPISAADLALMRQLDEMHLQHPFMGARMFSRTLAREGIHVGRRHVTPSCGAWISKPLRRNLAPAKRDRGIGFSQLN